MRLFRKYAMTTGALGLAVAAVATFGAGTAAASAAACTSGRACIYTGASWTTVQHSYYKYGTYKLYNEFGKHRVYNHQTGGAKMWLCTDSAGKKCPVYQVAGTWWDVNLTPYNSIKLTR
ncbi:hypothetical protein AB0436_28105 [Streptomyces sp. NPDC051322]|uniref:hypothetical protein n=1 Tax=Streptomyces sp. NPDC051322 TaxID=3154645 RepID=UPI00344FD17E